MIHRILRTAVLAAICSGCGSDVDRPNDTNEGELITTVRLRFVGDTTVEAAFADPDGDGGNAPTIDPIVLTAGSTYAVTLRFLDELSSPPVDITEEIRNESDVHQIFYTGSAAALLMVAYDDADDGGLPVGLQTQMTPTAGTGDLTVTLRHLPPLNDTPVKVGGLAQVATRDGLNALPGESDVSVTFDVTVQ